MQHVSSSDSWGGTKERGPNTTQHNKIKYWGLDFKIRAKAHMVKYLIVGVI